MMRLMLSAVNPSWRESFRQFRGLVRLGACLGALLAACAAAHCATLTATPMDVQAKVARAQCGDTIKAVGVFTGKLLINTRPTCPVNLDLSSATLTQIFFHAASNWSVSGGTFTGATFMAVQVIGSDHLKFRNSTYRNYGNVGISLLDSSFIDIDNNNFLEANADGADIVSSQDVNFRNNNCALSYSAKLHADCLQMWNKPDDPETVARVLADGNSCVGDMQCIDTFGAGDKRPVSDITITNNRAAISTQWAGAINTATTACIHCTMKGNHAHTLPQMKHGWEPPGWYNGRMPEPGNTRGSAP